MERHIADAHPHGRERFHELRREVEPRRRCGGGAADTGVDGLIALLVLELGLDVGGQGHPAQALQDFQKDALVVEADQAVAARCLSGDLAGELPLRAEGDPGAGAQLFPRTDQALPDVFSPVDEEKHLAGPAQGAVGMDTASQQAGGQDPGVVHDKAVAGAQEVCQVPEVPVGPGPRILVQHHQAGGVPPGQGGLGDELRGEVKVKVVGLQGIILSGRPATDKPVRPMSSYYFSPSAR